MHRYSYEASIGVGEHEARRRFLQSTTAISVTVLQRFALGTGIVLASSLQAFAGPDAEPIKIPLHHIKEHGRLGILVGTNGGGAHMYMFDTGSDQFNGQFYPKDPLQNAGAKTVYAYGDGSYAYHLQPVSIKSLTYYGDNGTVAYEDQRTQVAAQVEDQIYTNDYKPLPGQVLDLDKNNPIVVNGKTYYADLNARAKIENGQSAETDTTFGTFGAGDFLMTDSANSSAIGGLTKSGYIVSANANFNNVATPGCSPCTIINVNQSLRAQFVSYIPWGTQDRTGYKPTFPGSNANASTQYEGNYTYTFKFKVNGVEKTVTVNGPALFDTGTPDSVFFTQKGILSKLEAEGLVLTENDSTKIDSFSMAPDGQPEQAFIFEKVDIARLGSEVEGNGLILGLPFFQQNSVIYDLENKATGYTPLFVSADNFTTDTGSGDQLHLGKISAQMGNAGLFGIAGVISGSGALTLDPKTFVRMTNINIYTGATHINKGAFLSLAGPGSIERSARVVADGTFDISERGNANKYWGVPDSVNNARIRSLSGASTGVVSLGNQSLILTAANDTFAGSINDLGDDKKHYGGGLVVAGGIQTLSGKNDYTGMTTVDQGAGLLLAETGSITHDVTTSGLLGNDGQVGGTALAKDGGVIVGAGSFGAVTITKNGKIAPGSAFDPGSPIVALTVKGNFTQQAGSIYEAGLGTSADLIDVAGSAVIDSGAQVELVREGTMSINTRYNLLTAAGGVNGTYGGLTGALATDTPFVDFELAYDPKNIFLDTERTATAFAAVADTFNQRSTAAASETLGDGNPIHDSILFLTTQESRNVFNQLSGEIHASAKSALIDDSHFERDTINDRLRAAFEGVGTPATPVLAYGEGGPVLAPATTDRLAAWGTAFGSWGSFDGDGNAANLDTSTGGFLTGFDGSVNGTARLGIMAGYSHTSFDANNSSGSSDNYHFGLYGGNQWGALAFRSGLAYTWHDIETSRSVAMPGFADSLTGDYNAGIFQAYGELGYRIDTQVAAFEPFANLAHVNLHTDGFTEKGGAAALTSHGETTDTTFTTLGLRASTDLAFGTINATARGMLGWRHAFGDVTPTATHAFTGSDAFTVAGVPIAKDAALIEAGLDLNLTEAATLGISYRGQFGPGVQENGFNAKLAVKF